MSDRMTLLEKAALTSAVSGAVFNVFLFGVGATLDDATSGWLWIARLCAAVLQAAAFDLVAIATVVGMRHGRRSSWSFGTAVSAASVSALIALDVSGVWRQPWLHAAYALIVLAFMFHLLAPQREQVARPRQLRRLVRRLCAEVRRERATTDQLAAQLRQAMDQVRQLEQRAGETEIVEMAVINDRPVSLRQLAEVTGTPLTTLRRRLAQLPAPNEGGSV